MFEQENYDQFPGWFGGLFAASGSFYITTWGETSAGRTRYVLGATISTHISRKDMFADIIELVGGRFVQKKNAYYNRVTWEARSIKDISAVIELLDQVVYPMPAIVNKQHDIAKRFLATKMAPGRPKDLDLADEVQWARDQLYAEMGALTRWKKSLEYKNEGKGAREQ